MENDFICNATFYVWSENEQRTVQTGAMYNVPYGRVAEKTYRGRDIYSRVDITIIHYENK